MSEITTAARQELVRAISERYRTVSAGAKGRILDEFVALTGYHRKHAIRVLNGFTGIPTSARRGRLRLYDEAVRQALIVFWPFLLGELERGLEEVYEQPRGGIEPRERLARLDAFQPSVADETAHDGTVLLLDPRPDRFSDRGGNG